ncbi:MAG: OsmC family protein [Acidimicrobiia bacterium]
MARVHSYTTELSWHGSTGEGYDGYGRAHRLVVPSTGTTLDLSADPSFGGDPARVNPEELLLAAASSCQLLSFLAVAARARVDVVGYADAAEASMPEDGRPVWITRIVLRPVITLGPSGAAVTDERLAHLVEVAHRECFIANSLRSEIEVRPTFVRP